MEEQVHKPVMLREVMEAMNPQEGHTYIDATINGGGHATAILERIGERGKLLGIDRDCSLVAMIKDKLKGYANVRLQCGNFSDIKRIAHENGFDHADGILFDVGFSSYQIERGGRGFSFLKIEPLDMRFNPQDSELTAEKIVNSWSQEQLETILTDYGEERFAKRIARMIVSTRGKKRIRTTADLVGVIIASLPSAVRGRKTGVHPATRTFQALRIAVNNELEHLAGAIGEAFDLLSPDGTITVISFHSLEDRVVKRMFRELHREGRGVILTPKPLSAGTDEIAVNPRARSAKLRAIKKI